MVVSHESQETSDLSNILDSIDFDFIGGYSLSGNQMPQIGNLLLE